MANQSFEIIFAGDFREPYCQTTTAMDQLRAVADAGYQTGLLQLSGMRNGRQGLIHRDVRHLIDSGQLAHLDPNQALATKLLVITDPISVAYRPRRHLHIDASHRVVLISHGPTLASGSALYDWMTVFRNATGILDGEIIWAPSTPMVRRQLEQVDPKPRLSDTDWYDCIDPAAWRMERSSFRASRPVIGRSGLPIEEAWPNNAAEILSLYPDDPQFLVRFLNGGPILRSHVGSYPRNWEVFKSDEVSERSFLSSIDFFVYGYNSDRIDPIDPSLLRAIASGAVAIVPRSFEPAFGDGVVYAEPHEIRSKISTLYSSHTHYLAIGEAGIRKLVRSFSPSSFVNRVDEQIGPPDPESGGHVARSQSRSVDVRRSRRRVMFITINGVGMGHLTRMLAIANRCPASIEPVFLTMSQALKVLREQGYLAEFIPSRQYLDCDINRWNSFLRDEINEMISFYDPAVVIFDGNVPYQGLLDAIKVNPDPWFIWSRRGMWRSDNEEIIGREKYFDIVLEPGDLALADDHGITTRYRDRTHSVKPIRLLDESQMLSRHDARLELGLDTERPTVLIQLGAGNNFDYRSIHKTAVAHIKQQYDAQIAVGEWLISDNPMDLPESAIRMPGYPFARYFKAIDFAISAVGYNSFHELLFASVPTIFVPNEAMGQDNQLSRALHADRHGLAICVRANDVYRLTGKIDQLFKTNERECIKSRLATLDPANGASEAALLIDEMAYSRRVDRP